MPHGWLKEHCFPCTCCRNNLFSLPSLFWSLRASVLANNLVYKRLPTWNVVTLENYHYIPCWKFKCWSSSESALWWYVKVMIVNGFNNGEHHELEVSLSTFPSLHFHSQWQHLYLLSFCEPRKPVWILMINFHNLTFTTLISASIYWPIVLPYAGHQVRLLTRY